MTWSLKWPAKWTPWLLSLLVVVGVAGMGYWFYTHRAHNPVAVLPVPPKPDSEIELRFHNVELRGRKNGQAHWIIKSKQVDVSRDQRYAYLKQRPEGSFFNIKDWNPKAGEEKSRSFDWQGNTAEYDTVTNNLTIKGNTVIRTDAKEELRTEEVHYLAENEKVDIPGKVTVIGEKGHPKIQADKLDADLKLEVLGLHGHVRIDTLVGDNQQIK